MPKIKNIPEQYLPFELNRIIFETRLSLFDSNNTLFWNQIEILLKKILKFFQKIKYNSGLPDEKTDGKANKNPWLFMRTKINGIKKERHKKKTFPLIHRVLGINKNRFRKKNYIFWTVSKNTVFSQHCRREIVYGPWKYKRCPRSQFTI